MIKALFAFILLFSTIALKSQITVNESKKIIETINGETLNVAESDETLQLLYKEALNGHLPFDSITFLKDKKYLLNLQINKIYLAPIVLFVENIDGSNRAYKYLMMFKANKSFIKEMKKDKKKRYISIKDVKPFATCPLEPKYMDSIRRYNYGILKNNMQQIKSVIEKGEDVKFYKDFFNLEKLSKLKDDTLFVLNDNAHTRFRIEKLFSEFYPYKYCFISNENLENNILHTKKDFHYMHFFYAEDNLHHQISIVHSLTGEEIFHDKVLNFDFKIAERIWQMLVTEIDGKKP